MYGEDVEYYAKKHHYSLVCDVRETTSPADEIQYVAQEDLSALSPYPGGGERRILNTQLDTFFEGFREDRYQPRPWLRKIYPRDV